MSYKMLDAVSATGASSVLSVRTTPRNWTVEAITSTTETEVNVILQGSISQDVWFDLADHTFSSTELSNNGAMFVSVDYPMKNVRVNLAAFSAVGTITVNIEPEVLA